MTSVIVKATFPLHMAWGLLVACALPPIVVSTRLSTGISTEDGAAADNKCDYSYPIFNISGAEAKCNMCVTEKKKNNCKWCPLTQTCVRSGLWKGKSCSVRPHHEELDKKIKSSSECRRRPPWATVMSSAYGWNWPEQRLEDALKCVQWALGWPIETSKARDLKAEDENGRWNCVSALLRDGILAMLGHSRPRIMQPGEHTIATDSVPLEPSEQSLLQKNRKTKANVSQDPGPDWYHDRITWQPSLCTILWLKLKEEKSVGEKLPPCYVRAWKLPQFKELRKMPGPQGRNFNYTERLIESFLSGPLIPMKPGAGKSGSGFATTTDLRFKVKMGLVYNYRMNEPKNLMQLVEGKAGEAPSLAEHFKDHPDSLINRYHGMLKIALGNMLSYVIVMDDAFYDMDALVETKMKSDSKIAFTRYDLKGASRNQNERKKHGFCLVNGDFAERESGMINLADNQCLRFRSALKADVTFLQAHTMIDYSILLLSVRQAVDVGPSSIWQVHCKPTLGEPYCMTNDLQRRLYTFSIIDYINDKNFFKATESVLRGGKFQDYHKGILAYAKKMCPTAAEMAFKNRMKALLGRKNKKEKIFKHIDGNNDGKLNLAELTKYLDTLGIPKKDAGVFFEDLEKDEDGFVDMKAFEYLLS